MSDTPPELEDVEILGVQGRKKVKGVRLNDLAATPSQVFKGWWTITHLPSGTSFGACKGNFKELDTAISAMKKLDRLRNQWFDLPPLGSKEMEDLFNRCLEVCIEFGGRDETPVAEPDLAFNLNGYSGAIDDI